MGVLRRALPLLLLPLLAGCSSPHKLRFDNDAGVDLQIVVTYRETYRGKTKLVTEDVFVPAGGAEIEMVWFYEAPPEFMVAIVSPAPRRERIFRAAEYPSSLKAKSSSGPTTEIVIRPTEIAFP